MAIESATIATVSSNTFGGISAISNFFGSTSGLKNIRTPQPNILSNFTTYNYVLTISALPKEDYNFPDKTYILGKRYPIICTSSHADPSNRVSTLYLSLIHI